MSTQTTTKIPAPFYAAAGAGDLAMENLRKLPGKVADLQDELPARFTVLQEKLTQKVAEIPALVAELRQRVVDADTDKLRESARRNANVMRTNAQVAQGKAVAIYTELVTRGEQVVGRGTAAPRTREKVVAEIVPAKAGDATVTTEVKTVTVVDEVETTKRPNRARKTN